MTNLASALTGIRGEHIVLSDVNVSAALRDLLCEVTVSQTYRNDEPMNIEAVYTFPLPLDAVLLELQVEIGGRQLKGTVVGKKAAEETYEDAVASGDSAVMLQAIEPGLYTMNVGNLLPREKATITFSYAILYRWTGDQLRFFLPTTVAPRYGESAHQPHQVPESSLTVENQFALEVEIFGSLREAQFVCPSHPVTLAKSGDRTVITLTQKKAVMDRDFVLNVKAPHATRSFAQCGADGDGSAALVSFQPFFPGLKQPRPLKLAIIVDCSGSMQGDSIAQAKQALDGILESLQPHDHVTLIAFGSTTKLLSDRLLPCNKTNLAKAKRFADQLQADMGGTEIGNALDSAYNAAGAAEHTDIFLLTDGEVSSWEAVLTKAKHSGHRIFTVGVGSSVSEAFVRRLAADTGGECELVSPQEGMADRVMRHFERMRAPRAKRALIHWPAGSRDLSPSRLGAVFEGDTVTACARFEQPLISGTVVLEVETESGEITRQELPIVMAAQPESAGPLSAVARLAASARLRETNAANGLETALRYRLLSPWTNWLVIAERAEGEKAQDLPALRKVPQTLAAGWGGAGMSVACKPSFAPTGAAPQFCATYDELESVKFMRKSGNDYLMSERTVAAPPLPDPFIRLLGLINDDPSRLDARRALDLIEEAGLAAEFNDVFRHAADLGLDVNVIAAIVLAELLGGPSGEYLSPETQHNVASLQRYAHMAKEALREMARRGTALIQFFRNSVAHELLQRDQAHAANEVLERFAQFGELLERLQDRTRKSAEPLTTPPVARTRRAQRPVF